MFKKKYSWIYVFFAFLLLAVLIGNYNKNRKEKLLSSNTKIVTGIFERSYIQVNTGMFLVFKSKVKNKAFYFEIYENLGFIKKGDTVLIKYSVEDPNIAEVIDFCYMQKYKRKMCKAVNNKISK